MQTERLTTAQAIVKYLTAQRTVIDGEKAPLFAGVFAIFGHGNVTCLGEALEPHQDELPTWRGQNEQSMALAGIAYAKVKRRRQIMVASASIGPGPTNMVTAAAVAHANRLPLLLFGGDNFASRIPDPVLQQVEHFHDPTLAVNDAFKAVTRFWDRITRPEQIVQSLPQAVAVMLDPEDCGPAFISLPQDVQGEAFDFPSAFFARRVHYIRRPAPDPWDVDGAVEILRRARQPLIIAGGGVHYSGAVPELTEFAERRRIPVVETVAGKGVLVHDHPNFMGPIGVTGSSSANAIAEDADVVLAVGTRLQDFTTGSWAVFKNPDLRLVSVNVGRWDATKHAAHPVIGDALLSLQLLDEGLGDYRAVPEWLESAAAHRTRWHQYLDEVSAPSDLEPPSYAQVIRAVHEVADPTDYCISAAGGLPGELNANWHLRTVGAFDCEYGYSCMGYEIAGAWGAKMALGDGQDVICWVGDGSYLMMNSDIYSTVMTGHKVIFIVCDNGGFAVINRLQMNKGGTEFNNLFEHTRGERLFRVDFSKHAESMGAIAEEVATLEELQEAFRRAKAADRSYVIVIETHQYTWTEGGAWWDVGVPEVSQREAVRVARAEMDAERKHQRIGL